MKQKIFLSSCTLLCAYLIFEFGVLLRQTDPDMFTYLKFQSLVKSELISGENKANILLVTSDLSTTGAPMMMLRLAKALRKNGYGVAVFYKHIDDLVPDFEKAGVLVLKNKLGYQNVRHLQNLASLFDAAIVNSSTGKECLALLQQEIPTIYWVHELYDWVNPNLYINNKREQQRRNFTPYLPDNLEALRRAPIVTVSDLSAYYFRIYANALVFVIYNGIDVEHYKHNDTYSDLYHEIYRRKYPQGEKPKIVFAQIGTVNTNKAQELTIEAVKLLPKEYQNRALFYFVGWNGGHYAWDLYLKTLSMKNIVWTGILPNRQVGEIYELTDVLLTPSYQEAGSTVVSEAAMYGIPTIMSDNVGVHHLIKNDHSGFIFPRGNAQELSDKIKYFIDNPDKIKEFGKNVKENFEQTSTEEIFARKWINMIDFAIETAGVW